MPGSATYSAPLRISADPRPGATASALNGRRLIYEQPLAINNLIHRLVATQMELPRTLQNSSRLIASDVPLSLREMRRGLADVHTLTTTLDRETAATAPQLGRTGGSAEQTTQEGRQLLQQSQPLRSATSGSSRASPGASTACCRG
jgi:hypothetical protein